jgi:hypothetical protein
MRRREFITLVGGAVTALPFAVRAQQPAVPVIGLMGVDSAAAQSRMTAAFVQRLRELGWTEGRNVIIEYRWAEGRTERFAEIAAEFVQRNVSIISHPQHPTNPRGKARDIDNSDRVCNGRRSSRDGSRFELGTAGRQRNWVVESGFRYCRQETRTLAPSRSRSPPIGDYSRHWQSLGCIRS